MPKKIFDVSYVIAPILIEHIKNRQFSWYLMRFHRTCRSWNATKVGATIPLSRSGSSGTWTPWRRSERTWGVPLGSWTVERHWKVTETPKFLERRLQTLFVPSFFAGASCETLGVYQLHWHQNIKRWLKNLTKRCHVFWPWHVSKAA